ncbi:MAG: hypothetical protein GF333_06485 [Candidatus Omnitrophica bacterium]|nr:hypothetical protein [Candidatus Omnitrophota bacterium]
MKEKRSFPRVNVSFPLECRPLPDRKYFYTVSKDLSSGGVRIVSNKFMPKDHPVKVDINLIDRVVSVKARVAWCNKDRFGDRYHAGLQFVDMNENRAKDLSCFLNKVAA